MGDAADDLYNATVDLMIEEMVEDQIDHEVGKCLGWPWCDYCLRDPTNWRPADGSNADR